MQLTVNDQNQKTVSPQGFSRHQYHLRRENKC